jgi:hypothetical protein
MFVEAVNSYLSSVGQRIRVDCSFVPASGFSTLLHKLPARSPLAAY